MRHFFNLKYHLDKLNYKKVGDILFHSTRSKSLRKNKEDKTERPSMFNSFDGKFQSKSLLKVPENDNKKNNFSFSEIFSKSKIRGDFTSLSRNNRINKIKKELPLQKRFFSTKKSFSKSSYEDINIINDFEKKSKSLLFEKFPILSDDMYNLDQMYKKRELMKKKIELSNKNIISIPLNKDELNFRKNIDMKIKILKIIEKKKELKKRLIKKVYYKLGDKEFQNIKQLIKERDFNINIKIEKDPFHKVQNEYKKYYKKLKKEYNFYPYNYLEEHKDIDPEAFKFMVNNFNSNFSLFGKDNFDNKGYKTFYKKKEISKTNKPSQIYIKRIKRIKSKEGWNKLKLNLKI